MPRSSPFFFGGGTGLLELTGGELGRGHCRGTGGRAVSAALVVGALLASGATSMVGDAVTGAPVALGAPSDAGTAGLAAVTGGWALLAASPVALPRIRNH